MLNIEQLLAQVHDNQMRCVAGFKGLTNTISSFTIIDTPNIFQWLKGGEFVALLGYVTSVNPDMRHTLIQDLAAKGCAGLGIKMHSYYNEIPQEYITQGNMLDFPVLELPYNMLFSELAYHIHQSIFKSSMSVVEQTCYVFQKLLKLVLSNASVDHMLYDISQAMGNPVIITNKDFELIACEIPTENEVSLNDYFIMESEGPLLSRNWVNKITSYYENTRYTTCSFSIPSASGHDTIQAYFIAVHSEDELWGYLVIPETMCSFSGDSRKIIESITSVVSIYFMKNKFRPAINAGANSFLNLVLLNSYSNHDSIRYNCRLFGFDYKKKRVCLDIAVESDDFLSYEKKKKIRDLLEVTFGRLCREHNVCQYNTAYENHFLAFLLFQNSLSDAIIQKTANSLALELLKCLEHNDLPAQIGISACSSEITQIPVSFRQATEIIQLGKRVQPEQSLHSFESLKVYYTLSTTLTKEELSDMSNVLNCLRQMDVSGNTEYVETLERLINNKFNITKTANEMFLHRNSMNYRLGRIRDTLALDLENPEEVLKIQLALKALKLLDTADI